jgi:uncharacterized membrane protein (DUF106 family)
MTENITTNKKGSLWPVILVMFGVYLLVAFWEKLPFLKTGIHAALDPTFGALLNLNLTVGMLVIVFFITLISTLVQKYATDQKALKELREEQKLFQEEMKKYRENPAKMAELSKKQGEFMVRTFRLTSRATLFTIVPFMLFFKWFGDFFTTLGNPMFFGFMTWFWFYFIFTIIFSVFLRKWLKVL